MRVQCDYCRQMIDDSLDKCPYCGATINKNRTAKAQPKTIAELRQWYIAHNLPPEEVTRFFIGKDITEPKAFGIYKDVNSGDFVVYKNKADGTRAIRYQGSDEEYAVNELYQRLKAEIADQISRNNAFKKLNSDYRPNPIYNPKSYLGTNKNSRTRFTKTDLVILIAALVFVLTPLGANKAIDYRDSLRPDNGYYEYNGNTYYYDDGSWYKDDGYSWDWIIGSEKRELNDAINSETDSRYKTYTYRGDGKTYEQWRVDNGDFDDDNSSSNSYDNDDDSWDSDYDWDDDYDWDSGSSDWDSDW